MSAVQSPSKVVRKRRKRPIHPDQVLLSREQSALRLGVSVQTIKRLEQQGKLRLIRLTGSPSGKGFNPAADVHALANDAEASK